LANQTAISKLPRQSASLKLVTDFSCCLRQKAHCSTHQSQNTFWLKDVAVMSTQV